MKLLTVTIPAYNVSRYIERCLSGFVTGRGKGGIPDDIEILVINDGSTDDTSAVAKSCAERYPDVIRVVDKENGGHGSGINKGLELAQGRYFKVVDGDDWLNSEVLDDYLKVLRRCDTDVVVTDFCCVSAETLKVTEVCSPVLNGAVDEGEYRFDDICSQMFIRMHSLTWKTELLREHNIVIDEHSFYVDMEYDLYPIPYADSIYVTKLPLYMYRLGEGGQSVSLRSLQKNCAGHLNILRTIAAWQKTLPSTVSSRKLDYIRRGVAEMVAMQHQIYLSFPLRDGKRSHLIDFDKGLKRDYPEIYAANGNRAVEAIRRSGYLLFTPASVAVRILKK